jgi:hypothetical protein
MVIDIYCKDNDIAPTNVKLFQSHFGFDLANYTPRFLLYVNFFAWR